MLMLSVADQAAQRAADAAVVLAWITGTVALLNLGLFIATLVAAQATRKMADTTRDGIDLQREELEALKRQLDDSAVAQREAREVAAPILVLEPAGYQMSGQTAFSGNIVYVSGQAPATNVQVLVRKGDLFFYEALDVLSAHNQALAYTANYADASQLDAFGAREGVEHALLYDYYSAISWRDQGGRLRWCARLMHEVPDGGPNSAYLPMNLPPKRGTVE
jgi:hypothetical protein